MHFVGACKAHGPESKSHPTTMHPALILSIALGPAGLYGVFRFHSKVIAPRRHRSRVRGWIDQMEGFEAVRFIGMGREGIVYEVTRSGDDRIAADRGEDTDGPGLVMKVLYANNANARRIQAARLRRLLVTLKEQGFGGRTPLMRVYEEGELRPGVGEAPYVIMEKIQGRTLGEMSEDGSIESIPVRQRLSALDELLEFVALLEQRGLSFVHLDPDNVMIDTAGRPRLIDLDGLRIQISGRRKRIRFHRRIAKTVLALLGSAPEASAELGEKAEIERFVQRLECHFHLEYRAKKVPARGFESVADIRDHFRLAFALRKDPAGNETAQSG